MPVVTTLRVKPFHGIAPKYNRRDLPPGFAQDANNLRFDSADLRPLRKPLVSQALPAGDIGNLFYYRESGQDRYISFGRNMDVQGFRTPVPDDQFDRWYWCVSGEGLYFIADPLNPSPAGAAASTGSGADFRQFKGVPLGIPAPQSRPIVQDTTEIAAVGWNSEVPIDSITRTNPVTINTSSHHGFRDGERVRIVIDPSHPVPPDIQRESGGVPPTQGGEGQTSSVGQVWRLSGKEGTVKVLETFDFFGSQVSLQFDIIGISTAEFSEFSQADRDAIRIERVLSDDDFEARSYVFTYVSEFDEEGPPSQPSSPVDVAVDGTVQVDIEDVAHNFDIHGGSRSYVNRIRVYRTAAGETGAAFLFVAELNYTGGGTSDQLRWIDEPNNPNQTGAYRASFADRMPSVSLGELLPSEGWFPPPAKIQGMAYLANGYFACWRGNTIYFSDQYLPHAWDPDNRITVEDDVQGAESTGNALVVATTSRPYLVSGIDPSAMVARKFSIHAPLVHQFGLVDAGMGVLYVSSDGLVLANTAGADYLTQQLFDEHVWQEVIADRPYIAYYEGAALLYGPGVKPLLLEVDNGVLEASYVELDMAAADNQQGELAIVTAGPGNEYRQVQIFRDNAENMTARFCSGLLTFRDPVNFAVCQMFAEEYPVTLKLRHIAPASYLDDGQPNLASAGLSERAYIINGPEPFWLAAGFMSREWEYEIETQHRVQELVISTSMDELLQA